MSEIKKLNTPIDGRLRAAQALRRELASLSGMSLNGMSPMEMWLLERLTLMAGLVESLAMELRKDGPR